jgi:hypothetical protein
VEQRFEKVVYTKSDKLAAECRMENNLLISLEWLNQVFPDSVNMLHDYQEATNLIDKEHDEMF